MGRRPPTAAAPTAHTSAGSHAATPWSASDWERYLSERFHFPVRVRFGRSRTAPVQARAFRAPGGDVGWELRLHGRFADTPAEVRDALAKWLRVGRRARRAGPLLDAWIHAEIASLPASPRKVSLAPVGNVHDLAAIGDRVFDTEFAADFSPGTQRERPALTWGRRTRSRSRRSLRLGSYEPTSRVVRVHPVLDQRAVPEWFVTFVLKHEILHAVIDAYRDESGRWVHHGEAFREREMSWIEFEPAVEWERRNLARLIRSAREGTALRVRQEDLAPLPTPARAAGPNPTHAPSAARPRPSGEPGIRATGSDGQEPRGGTQLTLF